MLNADAKLVGDVFAPDIEKKPTRDGFGLGTVEAGKANSEVVVLCADLAESTRAEWFQKEFRERYIEVGVAEQNLASIGAGLAVYGKVPFIASYAAFSPGRNNEQIRTLISLQGANVKIAGMHAGISVGPDGATHQALEDIALMRVQPNMTVIVPADAEEARKAVVAAAEYKGPVYIRFGRTATPVLTTPSTPFVIGKAYSVWESSDPKVGIVVTGNLLSEALFAAQSLEEKGIGTIVLNNHTVKPLDTDALITLSNKVSALVTVEEHQVAGGCGSAIAEFFAQYKPLPIEFVGVKDMYGQSGDPDELIRHYGLGRDAIVDAVKKVVTRITL